eukprot:TRINITY_DN6585_c0_g1_i3.p1 TRINITY_DN6585_c0_g1~~TRINITY_DN6585_c0_g1_i3.p1  ORF type:complete len:279 (+),score=57.59 TRINITY_DN6585_c0_g1_i3:122-958(+)
MLVAKRALKEETKTPLWGIVEQREYEAKKKYRRAHTFTMKLLTLDENLIQTAVKSLQHHTKVVSSKDENVLSLDDECIVLYVTLSKAVPMMTPLPVQVELKKCVQTVGFACVMLDKLPPEILKAMKKSKLLTNVKFKDYESFSKVHSDKAKFAQFADSFESFFCDANFYDKLPKVFKEFLGKRNKCPYPVALDDNWEANISNAINKEYVTIRRAGKFECRVGSVSMEAKDTAANVFAAAHQIIPHILLRCEKHTNVQMLTLKTKTSIELPIYKLKVPE